MTPDAILSALLALAAIVFCVSYDDSRAIRRDTLRRLRAGRKG